MRRSGCLQVRLLALISQVDGRGAGTLSSTIDVGYERQLPSSRRSTFTRTDSRQGNDFGVDPTESIQLQRPSSEHTGPAGENGSHGLELQPSAASQRVIIHGIQRRVRVCSLSREWQMRTLLGKAASDIRRSVTRYQQWQSESRYSGWRMGVLTGLVTTAVVLVSNIILLLLGVFRYGGYKDGVSELARGSSSSISTISAAYHVVLNVLSTLLLGASNYSMQVLSSPTRTDIDHAHQKGQWLDVGVLSLRNLRHIDRRRFWLWCMLGSSSIPLHLL